MRAEDQEEGEGGREGHVTRGGGARDAADWRRRLRQIFRRPWIRAVACSAALQPEGAWPGPVRGPGLVLGLLLALGLVLLIVLALGLVLVLVLVLVLGLVDVLVENFLF